MNPSNAMRHETQKSPQQMINSSKNAIRLNRSNLWTCLKIPQCQVITKMPNNMPEETAAKQQSKLKRLKPSDNNCNSLGFPAKDAQQSIWKSEKVCVSTHL